MGSVLQDGRGLWPKYAAGPIAGNDGDKDLWVPVWVARGERTEPHQPTPGRTIHGRRFSHGSLYCEPDLTAQCDDASELSPCWDGQWAPHHLCDARQEAPPRELQGGCQDRSKGLIRSLVLHLPPWGPVLSSHQCGCCFTAEGRTESQIYWSG